MGNSQQRGSKQKKNLISNGEGTKVRNTYSSDIFLESYQGRFKPKQAHDWGRLQHSKYDDCRPILSIQYVPSHTEQLGTLRRIQLNSVEPNDVTAPIGTFHSEIVKILLNFTVKSGWGGCYSRLSPDPDW